MFDAQLLTLLSRRELLNMKFNDIYEKLPIKRVKLYVTQCQYDGVQKTLHYSRTYLLVHDGAYSGAGLCCGTKGE